MACDYENFLNSHWAFWFLSFVICPRLLAFEKYKSDVIAFIRAKIISLRH